jgi:hypothetical protein
MERLSLEQVEELLGQHPAAPEQAKSEALDTAADYIAGVLRQATSREQMKKAASPPPPPVYLPAPPPPGTPPPTPYTPGAPVPGLPTPPTPGLPMPPIPYLPGSPPLPGGPAPAVPSLPPDYPAPAAPAPARSVTPIVPAPPQWLPPIPERESALTVQSGTWQRISLAPGIELHYAVTDDARFNAIVERLVEAAVHILDELPEKAVEES